MSASEIDALTLDGCNALTGHGGRLAPHDGIRALMRAEALGGGEATAVLATLVAMGAGLPQSWPKALDLLRLAAERGSVRAQGQLLVLTGTPAAGEGGWAALAQQVDVAAWTTPPPKQALSETPRIRRLDGFLSAQACAWLIGLGQGDMAPAQVYDAETGGAATADARSNSALELSIVALDVVAVLVRARSAAAAGVPFAALEPPQLMHYAVGQKFDRHYDFLDVAEPGYARDVAARGQRIITFLIYLNDGFEGGATEFPRAGLSVRGGVGDAVMFANVDRAGAPDPLTLHLGAPPTRGEKWLWSQWMRDRIPAPVG